ncbi:hypothetical protein D3C86_1979050 [compost metagenome]
MSTSKMQIENTTFDVGSFSVTKCCTFFFAFIRYTFALYHLLILSITIMANNAAKENQIILNCPKGTMIAAANRGPNALPAFPPT